MSLASSFEFDGEIFTGVSFVYSDGAVKMNFSASGFTLERTKKLIKKFVDDAKNKKYATIAFGSTNDGITVATEEEDKVTFTVSKYEKRGTGDLELSLPLNVCLPAFESLIQ